MRNGYSTRGERTMLTDLTGKTNPANYENGGGGMYNPKFAKKKGIMTKGVGDRDTGSPWSRGGERKKRSSPRAQQQTFKRPSSQGVGPL